MWEQARWCAGADKTMGDKRWYWLLVFENLLYILYYACACKILGHKLECEADAENGSEDVWCTRCGWSSHYYMN